jgi:hypothetical protein
MPRKPKSKEDPTIAPEEWNFEDKKRLPDAELDACFLYEYARERARLSPLWQSSVKEIVKLSSLPKGHPEKDKYFDLFERLRSVFGSVSLFWECSTPDFATRPWQSFNPEQRRKLVEQHTRNKWESFQDSIALRITLLRDLPEYAAAGVDDFDTWMITDKCFFDGKAQRDQGFIAINWDNTDDVLKAKFTAWLNEKRGNRKAMKSLQGKIKLRQNLKALGARRLLDAGFTVAAAMGYSQKILGNQPLYAVERSWSNAKNKVVPRVMASLFGSGQNPQDQIV